MTDLIRAFIALDLTADVRRYLGELSQQLDRHVPPRAVRWVRPETMHLTLKFLGDDVTPNHIKTIQTILDKIATSHAPLSLTLSKLGCFPNPKAPRVIWVGVAGDVEPLLTLKTALDQALQACGWEPEGRKFNPHLTLGRVKGLDEIRRSFLPYGKPVKELTFAITAVHLYQSQLTPKGPHYEQLHTAHFQGTHP